MSLERRISIVTLGVEDVSRATAFYERLGWVRSSVSQPTITFIQLKGVVLALFSRQSLAEDAGIENSPKGFSGMTLAHNAGSDAEVDSIFAFALSVGAQSVKPPHKVFWGGYSGYFADPDGHLWEVAHNPYVTMDENGHLQLPE